MTAKGHTRPAHHGNQSDEYVTRPRPDETQGCRRERHERHVQRQLDPTSQDCRDKQKCGDDEHAAHEKRLRVIEKKPPEGSHQAGERDHEQDWALRLLRSIDVRPSAATDLAKHQNRDRHDDGDSHNERRFRRARRLPHGRHGDQQRDHDKRMREYRDPSSNGRHRGESVGRRRVNESAAAKRLSHNSSVTAVPAGSSSNVS